METETETETETRKQFPSPVSVSDNQSKRRDVLELVLQWLRDNPDSANLSGKKISEALQEVGIEVSPQYINRIKRTLE